MLVQVGRIKFRTRRVKEVLESFSDLLSIAFSSAFWP